MNFSGYQINCPGYQINCEALLINSAVNVTVNVMGAHAKT